ncbi:RNA-binding protein 34 [Apodemus speciosus]|uniref:RNA-binding protein 34 n=1 Tax=Apodemus speciosus TaxID=105296 RepID=A0ABQ0F3G5_APOSI
MALGGEGRKRRKGHERRQSPEDGVGNAATDYLVGQVADSLWGGPRPPGGGTGRLAALFSTAEPSAPPVFVPVPQETSKKRKLEDKEESVSVSHIKKPVLQQPARKVKVKKLSDADKKLANRESSLASADLEEELHQDQGQGRRRSQSRGKVADGEALDVALSLDENGGQRTKIPPNPEEERLKNERTVFVGNLPVMW